MCTQRVSKGYTISSGEILSEGQVSQVCKGIFQNPVDASFQGASQYENPDLDIIYRNERFDISRNCEDFISEVAITTGVAHSRIIKFCYHFEFKKYTVLNTKRTELVLKRC